MIPDFLKKDHYAIGVLLGIVLPILFYGILWLLDSLVFSIFGAHMVEHPRYLYLLSTIVNLYPIRVYLVNFKMEKTGKGVLLVSFVGIILYFFMFYNA